MLDKLEYLLALATERHFGRAAQRAGVTQPTLSAGIRQLEEQLGVTLVHRGSRFKSLTAEGERVLHWGRRILDDVRSMKVEVDPARRTVGGRLRISAVPTALTVLPRLTVPFLRAHPAVTFEIRSRTGDEVQEDVRNFDADVGLTYLTHEAVLGFAHRPLYAERYCLLVAGTDPLAGRDRIGWGDLAGVPLCLLDHSMQNRRILDEAFAAAGIAVDAAVETNSMLTLVVHVRMGGLATVLPDGLADALGLDRSVVRVPIEGGPPPRIVGLVIARREPRPLPTAAFYADAALDDR